MAACREVVMATCWEMVCWPGTRVIGLGLGRLGFA